ITLPVFYAMKDPLFKEKAEHLFRDTENINQNELTEVINYLKQTDAIEQSYNLSNRYLNKALNSLEFLPNNKVKKTLKVISRVIRKRTFEGNCNIARNLIKFKKCIDLKIVV